MNIFYVLFSLSIMCPIYTYALYPMLLKVMKRKNYEVAKINPTVTVVITGENTEAKLRNINQCEYKKLKVIEGGYDCINKADGEIVIFTDTKTHLDLTAIRNIVQPFADGRIGCVVGQQINSESNSVFWKYENLIKKLESRIGCVSGATESLFAVRKSDIPLIEEKVLNKSFYIVTKITENGKDVVFEPRAKAYEGKSEGTNFIKHVQDAAGYWQALKLFPKMFLFNHGSFVYVSHRVMKWFVWLNMLTIFLISAALSDSSKLMSGLFWMQLIGYAVILFLGRRDIDGIFGKLVNIGYYFVTLNTAYFIGMF